VEIAREDRSGQHHHRDRADDMGRSEAGGMKKRSGHARRHRGEKKQRRPAWQAPRGEHAEEDDKTGQDADQADADVEDGEARCRHAQDHGAAP
jgi:hypothetical protein